MVLLTQPGYRKQGMHELTDWILIYGPPAAGKTTLSQRLAESLKLPFIDLDTVIEERAGRTISEVFAGDGEAGFRRLETEALEQSLAGPAGVLALGGGALLDEGNRRRAEAAGQVVCLRAGFDTIIERLGQGSGGRPLLDGDAQAQLRELLERRREHYESFSRQVWVDGLDEAAVVEQVQVETGRFRVRGMGDEYDVRIANGALDQLGQRLYQAELKGPVVLVSDANVDRLYGEQAQASLDDHGYVTRRAVFPAGEAYKTLGTIDLLWGEFLAHGLERGSTVVALGGGVVSDLAGFAAAVYLRGVKWVAVPTTLLAMVDAALGGKTGADLPQGKNLIGAFHPPALVLVDPCVLRSLPPDELRSGLAEVVKHGLLADTTLFEYCRRGWQAVTTDLEPIVRRAVAVKVRVIGRDPYEKGERAALNLGHTLGHAVEAASGFRLSHGQAVAIGMAAATRLSERQGLAIPGLAAEVQGTLDGLGLPVYVPSDLDPGVISSFLRVDKKNTDGQLRVVLPTRVGAAHWGIPLDDAKMLIAAGYPTPDD